MELIEEKINLNKGEKKKINKQTKMEKWKNSKMEKTEIKTGKFGISQLSKILETDDITNKRKQLLEFSIIHVQRRKRIG